MLVHTLTQLHLFGISVANEKISTYLPFRCKVDSPRQRDEYSSDGMLTLSHATKAIFGRL